MSILVVFSVFLSNVQFAFGQSGRRPVVVTADQPNVWTLDQAHYLLAQMHRRNLDLKAEGGGNLDPNEINGFRIDALRSVLDITAEYDEAIGVRNRDVMSDRQYNRERRRQLLERRDELNRVVLDTSKQIAESRIELEQAANDEKRAEIQARIDELNVIRDVAREQITQINTEIGTLSQTGELSTVTPTRASTTNGPSPAFGTALTKAVDELLKQFAGSPKLNASLRLDNYIQMQYEVLSKQLTLLRDEVGANEKLIFLEMPQSINTSYDKADNKWVQSRWNVIGYTRCIMGPSNKSRKIPCSRVLAGYETKYQDTVGNVDLDRLTDKSVTTEIERYESNLDIDRYDLTRTTMSRILTMNVSESHPLAKILMKDIENQVESVNSSRAKIVEAKSAYRACLKKSSTSNNNSNASATVAQNTPNQNSEKCKTEKETEAKSLEDSLKALIADEESAGSLSMIFNNFIKNQSHVDFDSFQNISSRVDYLRGELSKEDKLLRRTAIADTFSIPMPASNVNEHLKLDEKRIGDTLVNNRTVRVVDMFPKQSSLNVNDLRMSSNAFSFKGILKLLSGFGFGASYERNRERYSQFVQQELYSSSFGKGSSEFGWTFNPMPGTKRVASGTRTTFAVMVVPKDATGILLASKGCYFSRSAQQPQDFADTNWRSNMSDDKRGCSDSKSFFVEIPDAGNREFFATAIKYTNAGKGKRVVATIFGRGFTSQIGVLVNGVPLRQALGLAQPFIIDDGKAQTQFDKDLKKEVDGSFERVDSNQLVATFKLDEKFEGIPNSITLIAPGKSIELRSLSGSFFVNDHPGWLDSDPMFGAPRPDTSGQLQVEKVGAYKLGGELKVIITGKNLNLSKYVWINGQFPPIYKDSTVLNLDPIPPPKERTIEVIIVTDQGATIPTAIENPFYEPPKPGDNLRVDPTELGFVSAKMFRCYETDSKITQADFRIFGTGFTSNLEAFLGTEKLKLRPLSGNRVEVEVKNPELEPEIEIRDSVRRLKMVFKAYFKKPTAGCQTRN